MLAGEIHRAVAEAKADLVRQRREKAQAQKDMRAMSLRERRKLKKNEEAAARKAVRDAERARGLIAAVMLGSRAALWAKLVDARREEVANDTDRDHRAAVKVIWSYWLTFRFRKFMREEREKNAAAARILQRNYRIHYGHVRLLKRKEAADTIVDFVRAARRLGIVKLAINKYRMSCVMIQRYWKSKSFKKTAELGLLCKYWDRKKERAGAALAKEQERAAQLATQAAEKKGSKKGANLKKEAAKAKENAENMPKFQLKGAVPADIKRQVLKRWLSDQKAEHREKMNLYYAAQRRYDAQLERLAAVIEARRAMGAAPPKELGKKPRMPRLRLMPLFSRDYVKLIRTGEQEVERAMRRELQRKRKEKEEKEKEQALREAGLLPPEGEEEDENAEEEGGE